MLTSALSPTSLYKEQSRAEEGPSELMVESDPTSPPTVTSSSSSLRRLRRSRELQTIRTRSDSLRSKLPSKDLPLENERLTHVLG